MIAALCAIAGPGPATPPPDRGEALMEYDLTLAGKPPFRRLFLDALVTEESGGLERIFHAPVKYEKNPIMKGDAPWEGWGPNLGGTVIRDGGKLRMYYYCIADGEPTIAEDGKSMSIKLKEGVKYSPPVNRAVKCDDIKYAFERAFSENVPNAYATQYFGDIVGAPSTPTKGIKDISGITCPDDQTIAFALKTPTAGALYAALVMPITIPVPREYASKFDKTNPSTYDKNVVFTGPYMVKNNSEGKLTGWEPGKQIDVIRNPNWDEKTDFRPAYLDSWKVTEGNTDASVANKRILQGEGLVTGDGPPPADVLKQAEDLKAQADALMQAVLRAAFAG